MRERSETVTRGGHLKHAMHDNDFGRVKAQRLVEHRRVLPSRKESIYGAGQGAGRETEGRGAGAQAVCRGRAWLDIGRRACAKGTANMLLTRMTLDVSKLSGWLNANAFCRVERRAYGAERDAGRQAEGRGAGAQAACRMCIGLTDIGWARVERSPQTWHACLRRWTCRSSAAG